MILNYAFGDTENMYIPKWIIAQFSAQVENIDSHLQDLAIE